MSTENKEPTRVPQQDPDQAPEQVDPAAATERDPELDPERDTVREVTKQEVAAIFEEENLEYRIEDDIVRSGFINAAIVVAFDDNNLVFEALWRGELPRDNAGEVLFTINEFNQTRFAPTLRFFESDEHLAISAVRAMDITHGASFNQLGSFIVSSIGATLEAFEFLAASFPAAVTWEEAN